MKWFEKHTTDRNDLDARQIRQEFGTVGYGVYEILQQIVAENMEGDDISEWGYVSKDWDMPKLAEEVGLPIDEFRSFITFCNDRFIIEKRNGRMFLPKLLERMNEYAKKQYRRNKSKKSKYPDNPDKQDKRDISGETHVTTQHNTTQNNLDKSKLVKTKQKSHSEINKNVLVDHTLEEFKRVYGFLPTDKYPRRVAWNTVQRIRKVTADRIGGELTDSRLKKGLSMFFDWVSGQESLEGIQKLETAKLKINIFMEQLPLRKDQSEVK